jgi:type VI secretion system protein ImpI
MALTLTIENATSLPDGGPLSIALSGGRGIDIGRDEHLDWTLPDPTRGISKRHCEIRFRDGGYWLRDVSTNGTFVNGASSRVQSPYRLRQGDRLEIGQYIIAVALDEAGQPEPAAFEQPPEPPRPEQLWEATEEAPPPIPRRDLLPPKQHSPVHAGFIDWAADIPVPVEQRPPAQAPMAFSPAPADDFAWAPAQPAPPAAEPEAPPPIPTPRRPSAPVAAPADTWGEIAAASESGPVVAPSPTYAAAQRPAIQPIPPGEFLQRFARGAGIPAEALASDDPGAFAEELGALMRVVAVELKQLLAARAESKRIARSASQTMIQAQDNNPLKFSPTVDDAMKLILGRPTSGYLTARKAFEESFRDLKAHQIKTYSAMQHALRLLVEDLDPQAVTESLPAERGIEALIGSRKARLWDAYVARWDAKTAPYEDGLVDAFMLYFAECYDRGGR